MQVEPLHRSTFRDGNVVSVFPKEGSTFIVCHSKADALSATHVAEGLQAAGFCMRDDTRFKSENSSSASFEGNVEKAIGLIKSWAEHGFPDRGGDEPPDPTGTTARLKPPAPKGGGSFAEQWAALTRGDRSRWP